MVRVFPHLRPAGTGIRPDLEAGRLRGGQVKRFIFVALLLAGGFAQAQIFPPTEANAKLVHERAVEAFLWGLPAVNTDLMLQQMLSKTPGKVNQFVYWGRPLDARNQTLTPNPDTLYF